MSTFLVVFFAWVGAVYVLALVWAVASHVGYMRALRDLRPRDRGQESAHRVEQANGARPRVHDNVVLNGATPGGERGIAFLHSQLRQLKERD